ncbi:MAG: YfcE family phosphodiesterase [Spirochaetales bacterium]|jgi:putative phosphoesterase|nr:YfcE family phosphodiesterase [Spirochaetales bacterium]
MKIAVISDIHENYQNLLEFLKIAEKKQFPQILFLGDFMNAGIARVLARSGIPVYAIWGNNDGDRLAVLKESLHPKSSLSMAKFTHGVYSVAGRKLFLSHHPELVSTAAASGMYDAVLFGHTHKTYLANRDSVLILNPGEISAHKYGRASYAVYDTETNSAQLHYIDNIVTVSVRTKQVAKAYEELGFNSHDEYDDLLT